MGGDNSKATGTDFDGVDAARQMAAQADDIPTIPFLKNKEVMGKLDVMLKQSIWLANFKRAFRGYLRKKPERSQEGTFQRCMQFARGDADQLGLKKDRFGELLDKFVDELGAIFIDDSIDYLKERGKIKPGDPQSEIVSTAKKYQKILFSQVTNVEVTKAARKIYDKYSRGADPEQSDVEIDPETKAKLQAEKEARLKEAAEERKRQAEKWQRDAEEEARLQEEREREIKERQEQQAAIEDALI